MAVAKNASRTTIGRQANEDKVTGFSGKKYDKTKTKKKPTSASQASGGLSGLSGKAGGLRYGATESSSVPTRSTATGIAPASTPSYKVGITGATVPSGTPSLAQTPSGVPGSTGVGGAGSGAGGATVPFNGADYTGWAAGLRPGAYDLISQEPQALLRQVMVKSGLPANDNLGMYNMLLPKADPNMLRALAMIFPGNSPEYFGTENQLLNFYGDFFKNQMTAGGQGVDVYGGIENIMNATPDSQLWEILNNDDPRGQVAAVQGLVGALAESGMDPLFAQAMSSRLNRLADEYYQQYGFSKNPEQLGSYVDKLRGRGF